MSVADLIDRCARRMKWFDFFLLKLSVFFATLFLVAVWQGFRELVLGFQWYWYLLITIILCIPLVKKMFSN